MKLFQDYSCKGSLYTILSTCFSFKNSQDWRRFDFNNPLKKEKNLELFESIESSLLVYILIFFFFEHNNRNLDF